MRALLASLVWLALVACVGPEDNPTSVKDLRVLGITLDPPELMAPSCPNPETGLTPELVAPLVRPVAFTALVQDPNGLGRKLQYEIWACAFVGDRDCSEQADRVRLVPSDPDALML